MDYLILALFILILVSLTIISFVLFKKKKVNLMVSGIMIMLLGPVIGFSSGALFLHFYDWSSGGTGEGAGFGGAILGLVTIANGILIFLIGMIGWMITLFRKITN
ncbi:inner-membrane translocator [Pradoshia sp.]|uniref:inner-membrane translocator n=1 Tax=Pradoshia sp. TaxID=2651281 RepID=UPI003F0FFAF4